eukprot:m.57755 g.57755  ORF g.57755 m.57755 type:complete len:107 (-) comp13106_c0_seq1:56-376(-)
MTTHNSSVEHGQQHNSKMMRNNKMNKPKWRYIYICNRKTKLTEVHSEHNNRFAFAFAVIFIITVLFVCCPSLPFSSPALSFTRSLLRCICLRHQYTSVSLCSPSSF